jgi:hypothetical protein
MTTETTEITFKPEADHAQDKGTNTQMSEALAPKPEASSKLLPHRTVPIPAETPPAQPSVGDLERWLQGEEVPEIGALFARLDFARLDWARLEVAAVQAANPVGSASPEPAPARRAPAGSRRGLPEDLKFHRLPEIGDLRVLYKNHEVSRRRVNALHFGWRELGGKRPAEWTVVELLQVLRRDALAAGRQADPADLLSAARDVWRTLEPPRGQERLEELGKALAQLRMDSGA